MQFKDESPIIILGMHRSGTSLLTREISKLGVFLGKDHDRNSESRFFIDLNEKIINESGGRWDNPTPIRWLYEHKDTLNLYENYFKSRMQSPMFNKYLGVSNFNSLPKVWGWKDPRNTFTVPIWKSIFPKAKFIIVERHGLDVAFSLIQRRNEYYLENRKKLETRKHLYSILGKRGTFVDSVRCHSIENAVELWHEYSTKAREYKDNAITIRFEDYVINPIDTLHAISEFLQIPINKDIKSDAIPNKAYSYKSKINDDTFKSTSEKERVSSLLCSLDYDI
jgi:hypothetical protein